MFLTKSAFIFIVLIFVNFCCAKNESLETQNSSISTTLKLEPNNSSANFNDVLKTNESNAKYDVFKTADNFKDDVSKTADNVKPDVSKTVDNVKLDDSKIADNVKLDVSTIADKFDVSKTTESSVSVDVSKTIESTVKVDISKTTESLTSSINNTPMPVTTTTTTTTEITTTEEFSEKVPLLLDKLPHENQLEIIKKLSNNTSISPPSSSNSGPACPSISDILSRGQYSQAAFLAILTDPCRYDKLTRPPGLNGPPVNVSVQIDIRHIEAAEHLQFKMHMLLQYRYTDSRLAYSKLFPTPHIVGEEQLRSKIWVPHVLLDNERQSSIMGLDSRDIYISIAPDGEVIYSRRITATLYCWMDLQKFPFDEQDCDIVLMSWTYNTSDLRLEWEKDEPVLVAKQLHLTEYALLRHKTESSERPYPPHSKSAFHGNYSILTFKFHMAREMGFYMMDYFIPSILLVTISWVSFWLQADASAPRITIGCSTMLSFITLASAQGKTLPKVSYIKASEIWFLGCTVFIFGSMVEFAFVNIIWRRKSDVVLKEVNSKNIFKCTVTPRLARKEYQKELLNPGLHKSHSCSSLNNPNLGNNSNKKFNNYLTVHSFTESMTLPKITTESVDDLISPASDSVSIPIPTDNNGDIQIPPNLTWTTMTPQQISQWIDKRSRIVFPIAFLVFNAFYWGFVYGI